jgi:hypothetical protein
LLVIPPIDAAEQPIELRLEIADGRGFELEAVRPLPAGTAAFAALRSIVQVKVRKTPGLGPMITGLCGIEAPRGHFWALYRDGELAPVGIGDMVLDRSTTIGWRLEKTSDYKPAP